MDPHKNKSQKYCIAVKHFYKKFIFLVEPL